MDTAVSFAPARLFNRMVSPALDLTGAWRLHTILIAHEQARIAHFSKNGATLAEPQWCKIWLRQFDAERFPGVPEALLPEHWPVVLQPAISFIASALANVHSTGMSHLEFLMLWRSLGYPHDAHDALNIWSLAYSETDDYLRTAVMALACLQHTPAAQLRRLGADIRQVTENYGSILVQAAPLDLRRLQAPR